MQYGFSKPILVKVAPGITAVERVKQEKLKSLNTKIKSLSLIAYCMFPTQFCIHPTSPAMPNSICKLDNYMIH